MEMITELLGAVFGVLGTILVGKKIRWGWMSWIISDISLIIFSIITHYWFILALSIIYLISCIHYWFEWKPKPFETNWG